MTPRAYLLFILSILLSIFLFVFLLPRLIIITNIQCQGPQACSVLLENKIKSTQNKNLSTSKTLLDNILKKELAVQSYNIRYIIPSTLIVYAIERKEALCFKEGSKYAIVDSEGFITRIEDNTPNLIQIQLNQDHNLKVGQQIPDNLHFYQMILEDMFTMYHTKSAIEKDNDLVINVNNLEIIFPQSGDEKVLVGSAKASLSWLNKQKSAFTMNTLDLRFKNPVLKYTNG